MKRKFENWAKVAWAVAIAVGGSYAVAAAFDVAPSPREAMEIVEIKQSHTRLLRLWNEAEACGLGDYPQGYSLSRSQEGIRQERRGNHGKALTEYRRAVQFMERELAHADC